jgi:hypothetical protein
MPDWFPPRFKPACLIVGTLDVLVGAAILVRGVPTAMAEYGVPEQTLASPHYVDAINWVYVHTVVLGLLIALVGWRARDATLKLWFSRLMVAAYVVYGTLDFTHSDSALGNGLYEGSASVVPAVMAVVMGLLFVGPSLRREG